MSDNITTGLRLAAYVKGEPIRRLEYLPTVVASVDDRFVAAFVRMGGESSPWGIAWRAGGGNTTIRWVGEARNRTLVADLVADFGSALLDHFFNKPHPQLWLPGSTHVDMLHFLALRYTFTKWGEESRSAKLRQIGALCGHLFESINNPLLCTAINATDVLRRIWVLPCEPTRENHLGFVTEWLSAGSPTERKQRAQQAELRSTSTSLDPELERSIARIFANRAPSSALDPLHSDVGKYLENELERRITLLDVAIELSLSFGKSNPASSELVSKSTESLSKFKSERLDPSSGKIIEAKYARSPETDHNPIDAARAFLELQRDIGEAQSGLETHDRLLHRELLISGEAAEGTIRSVDSVTIKLRTKRFHFELECEHTFNLRMRTGDKARLVVHGHDPIDVRIESITSDAGRPCRLGIQTLFASDQVPKRGAQAILLPSSSHGATGRYISNITELKKKAQPTNVPGRWILDRLLDGGPVVPTSDNDQFDGTNVEVDPDA